MRRIHLATVVAFGLMATSFGLWSLFLLAGVVFENPFSWHMSIGDLELDSTERFIELLPRPVDALYAEVTLPMTRSLAALQLAAFIPTMGFQVWILWIVQSVARQFAIDDPSFALLVPKLRMISVLVFAMTLGGPSIDFLFRMGVALLHPEFEAFKMALSYNLNGLFLALLVAGLAEVMRLAAQMQHEQSLTV